MAFRLKTVPAVQNRPGNVNTQSPGSFRNFIAVLSRNPGEVTTRKALKKQFRSRPIGQRTRLIGRIRICGNIRSATAS